MATMTITYPASVGNRLAAALGEVLQLKDNQDPPQPRDATAVECKQFVISRVQQFLIDHEGAKLNKAALSAVVVPAADIT